MASVAIQPWLARGAWDGILITGRHGRAKGEAGVRAMPRQGLALATIIGRKDRTADLQNALSDLVGVAPPTRPMVAHGRDGDLVWAGPEQWLLVSETPDFASRAATRLAGLAAVGVLAIGLYAIRSRFRTRRP